MAPSKRGIGMLVVGSIGVGLGVSLTGVAAWGIVEGRHCRDVGGGSNCVGGLLAAVTVPFAIVGFAVGVPLLVVGGRRHMAWKRWQRAHHIALRPQLGRTLGVWTTGLELRF